MIDLTRDPEEVRRANIAAMCKRLEEEAETHRKRLEQDLVYRLEWERKERMQKQEIAVLLQNPPAALVELHAAQIGFRAPELGCVGGGTFVPSGLVQIHSAFEAAAMLHARAALEAAAMTTTPAVFQMHAALEAAAMRLAPAALQIHAALEAAAVRMAPAVQALQSAVSMIASMQTPFLAAYEEMNQWRADMVAHFKSRANHLRRRALEAWRQLRLLVSRKHPVALAMLAPPQFIALWKETGAGGGGPPRSECGRLVFGRRAPPLVASATAG